MSNSKRTLTSLLFSLFLIAGSLYGQSNSTKADSLDKQFEAMLKTSNNFQDYKVIKQYKISDLRTATLNEINTLSGEIETLKEKKEEQSRELVQLQEKLESTNIDLEAAEKSKDEFSWMGAQIQKGTYQGVVYGIIIILVLILVFFILRYKNSIVVTSQTKKNLEQMEREFDEYRKKALDTQQKLGRQLQDERMRNLNRDSGGK